MLILYFLSTINNISNIIPSGKRLHNYGKSTHFQWVVIHYFDWAMASIANCDKLPEGTQQLVACLPEGKSPLIHY